MKDVGMGGDRIRKSGKEMEGEERGKHSPRFSPIFPV
jgi:hypothetical protein